jgi:hypothetical protein
MFSFINSIVFSIANFIDKSRNTLIQTTSKMDLIEINKLKSKIPEAIKLEEKELFQLKKNPFYLKKNQK